jgi:hypothetical protein
MAQNICCEDSVPTEDCSQSQATIEKMPRLTLSAARPSLSANPATQSWRAPSNPTDDSALRRARQAVNT